MARFSNATSLHRCTEVPDPLRRFARVWTRVDTPSGQHNEIELGSTATTGATP